MSLESDLKAAAGGGDAARVVELIEAATEKDRRGVGSGMTGRFGMPRESPAWALAWLGTATARDAIMWWFQFEALPNDLLLRVVRARGKQYLGTLVRAFERDRFAGWKLIRAAVKDGLIERPEEGAYTRALVTRVGDSLRFWQESGVYDALLADAELLEADVWRIFEVDVAQELANARVYEQRRPGMPIGDAVGNGWLYALTRLAAEDRLDRPRLLDASLAALQRDFRPSAVGWYAKLHEALEPTADERLARLDTYLALLGSPVPSVVKEGLAGVKAIEDRVPPEELARAAPPALTQRQKAVPIDVLRLLGRAVDRDPDARPALLATVAEALAHEHADVQQRALALLEAHELDDRTRGVVLGLAEAVSPTLRPRVEALSGFVIEEPASEPEPLPIPQARPRLTPETAATLRAPVEPVDSLPDLIELAAALIEGQGSGEDAERFLDGVSRLGPEREDGFERRVGGIAKRASELVEHRTLVGLQGAEIVAHVVLAWTSGRKPPKHEPGSLLGFHALRAKEVADRLRGGGRPAALLARPTHSGGWIDPSVLAERRAAGGGLFHRFDKLDLEQARLRAADLPPLELRAEATVSKPRWGRESRDVKLHAAVPKEYGLVAERVVAVPDTRWWGAWDPWSSVDVLGMRWALTVLPGEPEPAYGTALRAAVVNREGQSAYGHPELVLEHALDPDVRISELGWKLVAAGLLGRPEEVKRAAVDVVVATISDGRFDAERLAAGLAWLVENELGKASRLEQPLRDAGRISRQHATSVAQAIVGFAAACSRTPNGVVGPLTVAHELALSAGLRVESGAERTALERIGSEVSAQSKLGRAARGLLAASYDSA